MVVIGAGLCGLLYPASWLKPCVLGRNTVSQMVLMAMGLVAMGRNIGCMNGAPWVGLMYMVRISNTYHSKFFTRAKELRVDMTLRPILELLLIFFGVFVYDGFIFGISSLASLVFNLIWFLLDFGLFTGK